MQIYHTENNDKFPKSSFYRTLLIPKDRLKETPPPFSPPISERQLQCLWADARWRPETLLSSRNEKITVLSPGTWNLEAGPDFLNAILLTDSEQRRIQGDIEIHIHPADWNSHKHRQDPRYNKVIAHITFYPGELPADKLPPGTIQISLADTLRKTPNFSFDNIDVTSYPYAVVENEKTPCAQILSQWSPENIKKLLEAAGEERLRRKTIQIQYGIQTIGSEQCLYEHIMAALGYKHNRKNFTRLAEIIPIESLRVISGNQPLAAYALLLGIAGLLPAKEAGYDTETRRIIRQLWDIWWKHRSEWDNNSISPGTWKTDSIRPQNHPVRRLAAAASIFIGHSTPLTTEILQTDSTNPAQWQKEIQNIFSDNPVFDYWKHHLTFSAKKSDRTTVLLGKRRIAATTTNVIIPFLAAHNRPVANLLQNLSQEQDNSLIRRTAFNLLGRDHNPAIYNTGLRQQGLLQIFYDFCLNMRNGCPDCQLAASIQ